MLSNDTVEEYFQFRESMRPFLEKEMGLNSNCSEQRAIETIEQLTDFEEHLTNNDPKMLNECAEMILVSKVLLHKHIPDSHKYLDYSSVKKIEKKLKI